MLICVYSCLLVHVLACTSLSLFLSLTHSLPPCLPHTHVHTHTCIASWHWLLRTHSLVFLPWLSWCFQEQVASLSSASKTRWHLIHLSNTLSIGCLAHLETTAYCRTAFSCVVTPPVCARDKVISCVIIVDTKIAKSGDLGISANCKHNKYVGFGEKLASVRLE